MSAHNLLAIECPSFESRPTGSRKAFFTTHGTISYVLSAHLGQVDLTRNVFLRWRFVDAALQTVLIAARAATAAAAIGRVHHVPGDQSQLSQAAVLLPALEGDW